jgi:hypothetical protein
MSTESSRGFRGSARSRGVDLVFVDALVWVVEGDDEEGGV